MRKQNQGIRQYSDAEKAAYYKKLAMAKKSYNNNNRAQLSGHGRYVVRKPNRNYIRGRGGYSFSAKKVGGALGGAIGGAIGNYIAPGIGGSVGKSIGKKMGNYGGALFKNITGFGDYKVRENSLMYPDRVVPSFGEDTIRVTKKEFVAYIDATTDFAINEFDINPGLSETFPWLSAIATNYQQYRVNGMVWQFVSTASDAIASTTNLGMGQVLIATQYDSIERDFVDAPQMLGSMYSNSGKPSENIMHAIECAPTDQAQKLYYVRSGGVPEGADKRLYDLGRTTIATDKMPAEYTGLGQLWVSYDITFCKSVQNNQVGWNLNSDKVQFPSPSPSNPFGSVANGRTINPYSNLGCTFDNHTIFFPTHLSTGYFHITYTAYGDSTAVVLPNFTYTNCEAVQCWNSNSGTIVSNGGTTETALFWTIVVKINDEKAKIVLSGGTYPASSTTGDLLISQVNGEMFLDL